LVNDIALLKLQSSVKKKPSINIVCLPETKFTEESFLQKSSKCYITGWGKFSESKLNIEIIIHLTLCQIQLNPFITNRPKVFVKSESVINGFNCTSNIHNKKR
jgi:hypothetical protein